MVWGQKKHSEGTIEMVFDDSLIVIVIMLAIVQMSEAALENSNLNHFFRLLFEDYVTYTQRYEHSQRDTRVFTVKCEAFVNFTLLLKRYFLPVLLTIRESSKQNCTS